MSIIEVCPECGTALGIKEEDLTMTYESNEKRIWKDCGRCEGRGSIHELVNYGTAGDQRLSYTCTSCGGSGKEPTDMVIIG
jgi:DnaJ-class molecular chaperone